VFLHRAYNAPPDPLAGFKGPTSKGWEGKGREWEREGRARGGDGTGKGSTQPGPTFSSVYATPLIRDADTGKTGSRGEGPL